MSIQKVLAIITLHRYTIVSNLCHVLLCSLNINETCFCNRYSCTTLIRNGALGRNCQYLCPAATVYLNSTKLKTSEWMFIRFSRMDVLMKDLNDIDAIFCVDCVKCDDNDNK